MYRERARGGEGEENMKIRENKMIEVDDGTFF